MMRLFGRWFGRTPASTLDSLCLGIDYSGYPVRVNWQDRCLLAIGESGSGKSGLLASMLVQAEPFVQAGLVQLYGIDLKQLELSASSGLFERIAVTPDDALHLLDELNMMMTKRTEHMAGNTRDYTTSAQFPRVVLVIDELAQLFRQDTKTNREFQNRLTALLGMGRACGFLVWGFSQNPRKEAIPVRDDFYGTTIALRMGEAEAKLLLPSTALQAGLMPWTFPDIPGLCGMWDPDERRASLFRTTWVDDDQLRSLTRDSRACSAAVPERAA
ncbi:hypothetical protein KIH79_05460 [Bifidobacterium sp. 82T10]|uniref:FtsK domain-containing protein n=1 Tax=Bifidobacterium miconis TaxID=2834435 RepID=A0ABS6WED1_9BIFI|nr:FtsK/SpoIIIE domain-containing protein [Bifidobacterium miconis]MBW3092398.1 hypothetical protein [Bifidobacterium miconis]